MPPNPLPNPCRTVQRAIELNSILQRDQIMGFAFEVVRSVIQHVHDNHQTKFVHLPSCPISPLGYTKKTGRRPVCISPTWVDASWYRILHAENPWGCFIKTTLPGSQEPLRLSREECESLLLSLPMFFFSKRGFGLASVSHLYSWMLLPCLVSIQTFHDSNFQTARYLLETDKNGWTSTSKSFFDNLVQLVDHTFPNLLDTPIYLQSPDLLLQPHEYARFRFSVYSHIKREGDEHGNVSLLLLSNITTMELLQKWFDFRVSNLCVLVPEETFAPLVSALSVSEDSLVAYAPFACHIREGCVRDCLLPEFTLLSSFALDKEGGELTLSMLSPEKTKGSLFLFILGTWKPDETVSCQDDPPGHPEDTIWFETVLSDLLRPGRTLSRPADMILHPGMLPLSLFGRVCIEDPSHVLRSSKKNRAWKLDIPLSNTILWNRKVQRLLVLFPPHMFVSRTVAILHLLFLSNPVLINQQLKQEGDHAVVAVVPHDAGCTLEVFTRAENVSSPTLDLLKTLSQTSTLHWGISIAPPVYVPLLAIEQEARNRFPGMDGWVGRKISSNGELGSTFYFVFQMPRKRVDFRYEDVVSFVYDRGGRVHPPQDFYASDDECCPDPPYTAIAGSSETPSATVPYGVPSALESLVERIFIFCPTVFSASFSSDLQTLFMEQWEAFLLPVHGIIPTRLEPRINMQIDDTFGTPCLLSDVEETGSKRRVSSRKTIAPPWIVEDIDGEKVEHSRTGICLATPETCEKREYMFLTCGHGISETEEVRDTPIGNVIPYTGKLGRPTSSKTPLPIVRKVRLVSEDTDIGIVSVAATSFSSSDNPHPFPHLFSSPCCKRHIHESYPFETITIQPLRQRSYPPRTYQSVPFDLEHAGLFRAKIRSLDLPMKGEKEETNRRNVWRFRHTHEQTINKGDSGSPIFCMHKKGKRLAAMLFAIHRRKQGTETEQVLYGIPVWELKKQIENLVSGPT